MRERKGNGNTLEPEDFRDLELGGPQKSSSPILSFSR